MLPVWGENNRNDAGGGEGKDTEYSSSADRPRDCLRCRRRLDDLNKTAQVGQLTAEQKQQFIDLTKQIKLLTDRRQQILARTGDEYVTDPPKVAKP